MKLMTYRLPFDSLLPLNIGKIIGYKFWRNHLSPVGNAASDVTFGIIQPTLNHVPGNRLIRTEKPDAIETGESITAISGRNVFKQKGHHSFRRDAQSCRVPRGNVRKRIIRVFRYTHEGPALPNWLGCPSNASGQLL